MNRALLWIIDTFGCLGICLLFSTLSTHRCSADKREIYKNFAQHDDCLSVIKVDDNAVAVGSSWVHETRHVRAYIIERTLRYDMGEASQRIVPHKLHQPMKSRPTYKLRESPFLKSTSARSCPYSASKPKRETLHIHWMTIVWLRE